VGGPLWDCTNLEQRAVITFLWAEGIKSPDIHWGVVALYGSAVSVRGTFMNG